MTAFHEKIQREVTSWEGVTARRGKFGTVEFRLGRHLLGRLPLAGLVDDRTVIEMLREAMTFHPVMGIGEVLEQALEPAPAKVAA